jgi:hypothetical protein
MSLDDDRDAVLRGVNREVAKDAAWTRFVKVLLVIAMVGLFAEGGALGLIQIHKQNVEHTQTLAVLSQHTKTINTETDLLNGETALLNNVKILVENVDSQTSPATAKRQAAALKAIQVFVVDCQDNHVNRDSEVVHHLHVEPLKQGCPNFPLVP